ncbi:MAG: protein N-lysine methyltransferase family protein [Planctomycetia bacterium]|nr:protein N-lysine methyltransferase family protein [Planctomycetia bacterium]
MPPRFHVTPPELVDETVRETVFIDDYTFRIERPTDSDRLFDHPWVRSAYAADEYVPHWPTLWPSARMLAKAVLREPWGKYPQPVHVLEIGCGLGLAGIACLARGLRVTFSDVDETALAFAAANARLNGYPAGFRTQLLDFRAPPDDVKYPVVIGSDLMYEERLVEPLVELFDAVLAPGGTCLIADPDRLPARVFRWQLEEIGYSVTPEFARAGEPGGERTKGTIYRVKRNAERGMRNAE